MKRLRSFIAGASLAAILPTSALAGSVIVLKTEGFGLNAPTSEATVYLDGTRIRIDSKETGADVTVIYNRPANKDGVFWLIDNQRRVYTEISRQTMLDAKADIEVAIEMAKKEFEELPPDQRKQAAKVFAERVGVGAFMEDPVTYKKVSSGIDIGGWTCSHYEGIQDGEKTEEVWAAHLDEIGLSADDLGGMKDMSDLFVTVGQKLPPFFRLAAGDPEDKGSFPGFPVVIVSYTNGQRSEKSEVAKVQKQNLADSLFALPKGLTKRASQLDR